MCTLDKVKLNQGGEILNIDNNTLTPKLTDMGLFPGKRVKLLFKAPFGDPIAIDVEGYTLSLRLAEAALIHIGLSEPSAG
jgi:Fe2+ transport system protein FeoA